MRNIASHINFEPTSKSRSRMGKFMSESKTESNTQSQAETKKINSEINSALEKIIKNKQKKEKISVQEKFEKVKEKEDGVYVITAYDMDLEKRVHFTQPMSRETAIKSMSEQKKMMQDVKTWNKKNEFRLSDFKLEKLVDFKEISKDGICPVGTKIQSIIIDKKYFTKSKAISWIDKHGYKIKLDEKEKTFRFRQENPDKFHKELFRTITVTKGIKAVIGCPVDKKMLGIVNFSTFSNSKIEEPVKTVQKSLENNAFDTLFFGI